MRDSQRNQERWANFVSSGSRLAEPWRSGFALLGQFPQVQEEQRRLAHDDYFVPALKTAQGLNLKAELGLALCFDIHVQNGGIGGQARAELQEVRAAHPPSTEQQLREIIANAVSDSAAERFTEDVKQRKLTIARGQGEVHGARFVLEHWGLGEIPAPELA
jgi:hypothetical protein